MDAQSLRERQAPLKAKYRDDPDSARVTLKASGTLETSSLTCKVETGRAIVEAGLHEATGGAGLSACSGEMLLEALVGCAGVTLNAVATSLGIPIRGGVVSAEGDLDFRGTLAVERSALVGFSAVRLKISLDSDAGVEQIATLLKLTERYCVIYQTLKTPPSLTLESLSTAT